MVSSSPSQTSEEQPTNSKLNTQNSTLSETPKPPVTHTLDEFSAQIDAALRPSPEILEKRKRQHEESLRQAEGNRQIRLIQIQYGIKPSSPFDSQPC